MSVERYSALRTSPSARTVRLSGSSTFEESVCLASVLQFQNCSRLLGVRSILIAVGSRAGRYNTEDCCEAETS
jgi:hypothetical protein